MNAEILQVLKLGEVTSCDINVNYVLAIGSSDRHVRVMELKTGLGYVDKNYSPINCHKFGVTAVKFSPRGTMLASASLDGTAIILDVLTGAKIYSVIQYNTISIKHCEFTPDSTKFVTVGDDSTCCFWNLLQHNQIRYFELFDNEFNIKGFSISPDSQYLISGCSEGLFNLWSIGDILTSLPQCLFTRRDLHDDISSCDFSPIREVTGEGQMLKFTYRVATCGTEGLVKLWDVIVKRSEKAAPADFECDLLLINILKGHDSDVYRVRFNSGGYYLASAGLDNYVNLWQVTSGSLMAKLEGHSKFVTCSAFSKDSAILATGSTDKRVIIWDLSQNLTLDSNFSNPCDVSSHFTNIDLLNYHSEKEITNHTEKRDGFEVLQTLTFPAIVNTIRFSGNDLFAVAGGAKTVTVWKKHGNTFVEELKLEEHKYSINCLEISPCGSKLISCSVSGEIIFWDLRMNLTYKLRNPHSVESLRVCRFSPNSKLIGAAGDNEEVYLWDAASLEFLTAFERGDNTITSLAFTPDSKFLVSTCSGGSIFLYNIPQGIIATRSHAHDLGILCCDFSSLTLNTKIGDKNSRDLSYRGGYLLATCGNDSYVKLWRVKLSGIHQSETLMGHRGAVTHVEFSSADGNILTSCASDAIIRVWDTKRKQCLHTLNGHKSTVTTCSFSQDSSLLVSGSLDKTVLIWHLVEESRPQIQELSLDFNKPLENWTAADIANWFSSISWPELANKIKIKPLDGKKVICRTADSISAFLDLECENDKKELKEKLQWLKMQNNFNCDKHILENVPHKYLCPITHQIMKNPVTCSDGFTYDHEAITEWFIGGNFTSPMTRENLTSTKLMPNSTVKINTYKFLCKNIKDI